jgi:hypothetical protein
VLAGLAQGARLLQGTALLGGTTPLRGFSAYVVGFHCPKGEPGMQMEAHHYCQVVNDDFLQCVLFDGNTPGANLIGIEYIVSERLFATLPEEERGSWHPHNYEVLSGELVAPGLPEPVERAFLARLVNSYGKTWHTWHTGRHDGAPGSALPVGEPKLMWSFNREGEAEESLKRNRDEHFGIDVAVRRERRQRALLRYARPQQGVDDMRDDFRGTTPVPGVVDVRAGR